MGSNLIQSAREWFYAQNPQGRWYLRVPLGIYHAIRRLLTPPDKEAIQAYQAIKELEFDPDRLPKVLYLQRDFPGPVPSHIELVQGGAVKYSYLDRVWPQAGTACNLLYGVSSAHTGYAMEIVKAAKGRGIRMVWNQDGVWVPEAYPPEMVERGNRIMAELLHSADYVLFQSQFCKRSSDHFLGQRDHEYEVLYNAVDIGHFSPGRTDKHDGELTLLIAGSHIVPYRLPTAIRTLSLVCKDRPSTRLLIAGQVVDMKATLNLIDELGLREHIEFVPRYTQQEAPEVYRRADILVHTKYNDPCPTVVIEAMACGLPVVYSKTGGVPELVGDEAGFGVESLSDWYVLHPPDPQKLAVGVMDVSSRLTQFQEAARERAVRCFDYKPWLKRHAEIFASLLER